MRIAVQLHREKHSRALTSLLCFLRIKAVEKQRENAERTPRERRESNLKYFRF